MLMEPVKAAKPSFVERNKLRLTAVVIAVIAASTAFYLLTGSDTGTTVNVTYVSVQEISNGQPSHFLGGPVRNITWSYITYGSGEVVSIPIAFHNSGTSSRTITSISSGTAGFTVTSSPVPVTVSAGSTAHVTVHVKVPGHNYAGKLALTVSVS